MKNECYLSRLILLIRYFFLLFITPLIMKKVEGVEYRTGEISIDELYKHFKISELQNFYNHGFYKVSDSVGLNNHWDYAFPQLNPEVPSGISRIFAEADSSTERQKLSSSQKKSSFFLPKRVTLKHVNGFGNNVNNFGLATNYSTLALLFASEYQLGHFMPMLDIRGYLFDKGFYAASVGVATRYIPKRNSFCELLGMNLYYDWRQGFGTSFNQIGVGLEVLSRRWDLRANAYIPIGNFKHRVNHKFDGYIGPYKYNHSVCKFTNYGFNLEAGYLAVNQKNFLFYAATGPYYFSRKSWNKTFGWELRVRPQFRDYLALDLSGSYDHVFQWLFQVTAILYLPLYHISGKNQRPCGITDRQIYQPIERFEVMPLGRRDRYHYNWKT